MWYTDKNLNMKSDQCDLAWDNRNSDLLLKLSEECRKLAKDQSLHVMIRAKLYYDGFTSLSNYSIIASLEKEDKEKVIEKSLYLCRKSISLQEKYKSNNFMDEIEEINYNGLYFQTIVNYCNILSSIGRLPKAIYENRKIAFQGFGMAIGNLGMELYDYGPYDYDSGHQILIVNKVCSLLKEAINSENPHVHTFAKKSFNEKLVQILGHDNFESKIKKIPSLNFCFSSNETNKRYIADAREDEKEYREWIAENCLALNTLNDFDYSINQGYDPMHLPDMFTSIDEKHPRYHGLFNQIKQEYCSARFMIYEGINKLKFETHFSDKDVFLINTLDYPVYGLNIELLKSAYRTIYSLFDRIGFFLNDYYSLGLSEKKVSFRHIWGKQTNLVAISESNYILKGLYWMKKDLYKNAISDYKDYIDPVLFRTYEIRNIMEHRYLKISSNVESSSEFSEIDVLSTKISLIEFQDLAMNLLRTCREAIILLVMLINVEEQKKKDEIDEKNIADYYLSEYMDQWKFNY